MKINYYRIITNAIDQGFDDGWEYAYRYTDTPKKQDLKEAIVDHIIYKLEDWFEFEEKSNEEIN